MLAASITVRNNGKSPWHVSFRSHGRWNTAYISGNGREWLEYCVICWKFKQVVRYQYSVVHLWCSIMFCVYILYKPSVVSLLTTSHTFDTFFNGYWQLATIVNYRSPTMKQLLLKETWKAAVDHNDDRFRRLWIQKILFKNFVFCNNHSKARSHFQTTSLSFNEHQIWCWKESLPCKLLMSCK